MLVTLMTATGRGRRWEGLEQARSPVLIVVTLPVGTLRAACTNIRLCLRNQFAMYQKVGRGAGR